MSTKIYIAAAFDDVENAADAAEFLKASGYKVTSTWFREPPLTEDPKYRGYELASRAALCIYDLDRSDALIMLTHKPSTKGGRLWEFGYAHNDGLPIAIVGPLISETHEECAFAYLPDIPVFPLIRDTIDWLSSI